MRGNNLETQYLSQTFVKIILNMSSKFIVVFSASLRYPKSITMSKIYIQGVSGGIINILGGGSTEYSE
jgi:hypothetical protein